MDRVAGRSSFASETRFVLRWQFQTSQLEAAQGAILALSAGDQRWGPIVSD